MLPSYEQRARLFKMATPYKNGTTFPPENEEVGRTVRGGGGGRVSGGDTRSRVNLSRIAPLSRGRRNGLPMPQEGEC